MVTRAKGSVAPKATEVFLSSGLSVEDAINAGGGGSVIAADVIYDNSTSGLTAGTVQAAIDEVVTLDAPIVEKIGSYRVQPVDAESYYSVEYSSGRSDINQYGYTANVKRTGGTKRPVAAQLNAYDIGSTGTGSTVFGIACEAWTGDFSTEPLRPAGLKGIEPAVISQWHDNIQPLWGVDVVFKNRADGGSILRGNIGSNSFNGSSRAINISSQPRSPLGEYCGWNKGIYFDSASLDISSINGAAIGIDMSDVPTPRLAYSVLVPESSFIGLSGNNSPDAKLRFFGTTDTFQLMTTSVERFGFDVSSPSSPKFKISGTQVVGPRITGWQTPLNGSSAPTRNAFTITSVTTAELAQRVAQIIIDLKTHGLFGS